MQNADMNVRGTTMLFAENSMVNENMLNRQLSHENRQTNTGMLNETWNPQNFRIWNSNYKNWIGKTEDADRENTEPTHEQESRSRTYDYDT